MSIPSVSSIEKDNITQLSVRYWAPGAVNLQSFDPSVIEDIFQQEISNLNLSRLMLLEVSLYLEK